MHYICVNKPHIQNRFAIFVTEGKLFKYKLQYRFLLIDGMVADYKLDYHSPFFKQDNELIKMFSSNEKNWTKNPKF